MPDNKDDDDIIGAVPLFGDRPHTPLLFPENGGNHERSERSHRTKDNYRQLLTLFTGKLKGHVASAKAGDFTQLFNAERDMHAISGDVATARRLKEYQAEFSGIVDELLDLLKRNWSQDH
jgi:hypothetical protein